MTDQNRTNEPQMTRDEFTHLGFTYLREDLQEVRQDVRELARETNRRFEEVNRRFEEVNRRFEAMQQYMDERFARQTRLTITSNIAVAGAIIAAIKL